MSLTTAWSKFTGSCACGQHLENNCAHFLSEALIQAGFTELDGGKGANERQKNGRVVCSSGRPIRAKELRDWAKNIFIKRTAQPTGVCFVYQERASDGQGHVLLKNGTIFKGTGDHHDWAQSYYS